MHTSPLILDDPEAFRLVMETPAGRAYHCADLRRYVVLLAAPVAASADEDTVPTRELWTNTMTIVCAQLGDPAPGQQVDIFNEAQAWSA